MSVRTQSLLVIVPVFLVLGLAVAVLACFFELRETTWALHEEASSYAASVAVLADAAELRKLLQGADIDSARSDLVRTATRAATLGRVRRLSVGDPGGNHLVVDVGRAAGETLEPMPSEPVEMNGALVTTGATSRGERIALAMAQIVDQGEEWVGTVRAEVDASALRACWKRCLGRTLQYGTIGMLLGIICALLAANLVLKPIRGLDHAAQRAATGDLAGAHVATHGRIREMHDLANAFNTLVSMLSGLVTRTRRAVYAGDDSYEPRADGRDVYDTRLWQGGKRELKGLKLDLTTVGGGNGAFAGFLTTRAYAGAVIGCMAPSRTLDAPLAGSACIACLNGLLEHKKPSEAVTETASLFRPQSLRLVVCEESGVVHSYAIDAGDASVRSHMARLSAGEVRAYHSLGDHADRRIELYAAQFCVGAPERIAQDLLSIVCADDTAPRGALLVVSRADASRIGENRITLNSGEHPL